MLLFVRYVFNFKGYPTFVYQSRKNTSFLRVEFSDNGISFHSTCHKIYLLHLSTNILCKLFHNLCSLPLYSISNRKTIPMIRAYLTSHHSITFHKKRNCCIIKQQFLICILSNKLSVSSLLPFVLPFSPTVLHSVEYRASKQLSNQ